MRFVQIASGIDTTPVLLDLSRNPSLWDQNPERRTYPGSPHAGMVDITARYMPPEDVTLESRRQEHRNIWWPAWYHLPSLRPLVFGLMHRVQAVELGSILLTKLKGDGTGKILPHSDAGNWAPEYYNCKAHITLSGHARVVCDGFECVFDPGTIWTFDNLLTHSIENIADDDRIVCIVSMRAE